MAFEDLPLFHQPNASEIAEARLADGLQRVQEHAALDFMQAAAMVLRGAALVRAEITANDLWDGITALGITTHDNRASGAAMRDAARRGWIVPTDRWIKSTRATRNRGDVRVWRSLIHRPAQR